MRALSFALAGLGLCLGLGSPTAQAVLLEVTPDADTSLLEVAPANNNGAQAWVNAGTTQNGPRCRGLFHFELSGLPSNALVRSVSLSLAVVHEPKDGTANAPFGLYRMLHRWTEGSKASLSSPGQGQAASPGETTWLYSAFATNAWSAPGAQRGLDFSGTESASQFIYDSSRSPYQFESTPELVADVQLWLSAPAANFGWLLLCDDEATPFTARRFASRQDTNNAPLLQIDYLVPPQLEQPQRLANQFSFFFSAQPGQSYAVQYRPALATGSWQTLASLPAQPQQLRVWFVDSPLGPQRLYRLVSF